ncbi:hypothetical protein V6N13_080481 [Hibiscus sabdariffa]|uniref:Uncharacterized protein n=1 Tax=Hibiscus sabdariffa TaxID=183260 RepID=A0ABR2PYX8_9ROSI
MALDLSSLSSVRNFVSEFELLNLPLNLLMQAVVVGISETTPGCLRMNMQSLRMESDDDVAPCGVGATTTGCELTIAIEEEACMLFG